MNEASFAEVERLRRESVQMQKIADDMEKELQAKCKHPFDSITLTAGATESFCAAHTDRAIYVRCALCDWRGETSVRWHKDA